MRLHFVWVGKTKDRRCAALIDDYLARIRRFAPIEISELREGSGQSGQQDEARVIAIESARLREASERDDRVILLDERGEMMTSTEMATLIERWQMTGTKRLAFVIGGFAGVDDETKRQAHLKLSLSRLTLTHELARVILTEQIYRALTIIAGLPYHKDRPVSN